MEKQKLTDADITNIAADTEKEQALEKGLPDPYFDFRDYYVKGDKVFYAYINELIGEKELIPITIRTIYARTIIGYEENSGCHVIGYSSKDKIFADKKEANQYLKNLKIAAKYS